ncbi:hypothetical protein V2J09_006774 [Rumex salicifolius]
MINKGIETETLLKSLRETKDTAKAHHHNRHQILRYSRPPLGGGIWGVRARFQFLSGFLVTILIVLVYLIKGYDITNVDHQLEVDHCKSNDTLPSPSPSTPRCDLFSGKWVYDNQSYPLYKERQCKFMSDHVTCEKNGRKDLRYQNWRWQPHQCDLPRLNATTLLERLRNKRLVYVGDSLNRGQWESMVCLVDAAISSPSLKSIDYALNASLSIFKAIVSRTYSTLSKLIIIYSIYVEYNEYNATIEFYWAPLLVESNSDDALQHTALSDRIVRVKAMEKHARHWTDAHVLVFDSYLWWRTPTVKLMWGSFGSAEAVYKDMPMQRSYEMALQTWADWLEVHVNRSKTNIFWATMSPSHERGEEWGAPTGSTCYNETQPMTTQQGYWGSGSHREMFRAVERAIDRLGLMGLKVQLLNITQLSEYRKEAHVSIYKKRKGPINKAQLTSPISDADCFHWCLPETLKSQRKTINMAKPQTHQGTLPFNPSGSWGIRGSFQCLAAFLVTLLIVGVIYFSKDYSIIGSDEQLEVAERMSVDNWFFSNDDKEKKPLPSSSCDLFSGKWVYDNESYPLYKEKECSFMSDQLACEKFGRKDLSYQNWRWQPNQCDLPRFNATALLERLRNKRLVYVGDSLNRGQWVSMVCLIDTTISSPSLKSMRFALNGSLIIFKAIEYNATIEFYWAPLLVESNSDDPVHHRLPDRIVRVQAIEKHARHWTDADVLVFDTYLWWRRDTMKVLWGSFGSEDGVYKEMKMLRSYEMALQTWADWLEVHVNRSKTQIFWVSMSPTHERSEEWGAPAGSNCHNETQQITQEGYWGSGSDPKVLRAVERTIGKLGLMGLKVQLLNITQLSEYRKEAHPSINRKMWDPPTEAQLSNPRSYADCFHWCLPGVPDTWNELLYALLSDSS